MVTVHMIATHHPDELGLIPHWLDPNDPRPAREQLDTHYQHGGGWQPFKGFKLKKNGAIQYPGDTELKPFALMRLRDEIILMFPHAWVMIMQPDSKFEICRMD